MPGVPCGIRSTSSSCRMRCRRLKARGDDDLGCAVQPDMATSRSVRHVRDGTTAGVRLSCPDDGADMQRFFDELSPASRRLRFLAPTKPTQELLTSLCNNEPGNAVTLVVRRTEEASSHIIGVGSLLQDLGDDRRGRVCGRRPLSRKGHRHGPVRSGSLNWDATKASTTFPPRCSPRISRCSKCSGILDSRSIRRLNAGRWRCGCRCARRSRMTLRRMRATVSPRSHPCERYCNRAPSRSSALIASRVESWPSRSGIADGERVPGSGVTRQPCNASELADRPCYKSVRDLPAGVELAIIAVPRRGRARDGGRVRGDRRQGCSWSFRPGSPRR